MRLFLIHWHNEEAQNLISDLTSEGWEVSFESVDGENTYKKIKEMRPDIILADLSHKPSHTREVCRSLQNLKATKDTLIIFVDGPREYIDALQQEIPHSFATSSSNLKETIKRFAETRES